MKTLSEYGKSGIERANELKAEIENGAKFNGIVYGALKGKYIRIYIFLDGKEKTIKEVEKADAEIVKMEVAEFLGVSKSAKVKTTWTVDGKSVENNLGYAEMYNRFGMDFE